MAAAEPVPLPEAPVLILGSTVTGGTDSIEALQVKARGLTPIVVDDATWASKTTADFASYRALIIGDPTCSETAPAAAISSAATWGPAVTGNVLINGTDPVFHQSQGGAEATQRFIDFAVGNPDKTGAYISLSCNFHGVAARTPVPLLDALRPGGFSVTGVGCYDDAHIVATHPALAGLSDSTLSNWGCSVHEAFDTYPPDFQVLAMARNIGSTYTASDGTVGTPYILASGAGLRSFPLSLSPSGGTAPTGGTHTVTAQLLDAADSKPVAGASISFAIIAGPDEGIRGTCSSRLECPETGGTGTCNSGMVCSTDAAGQVSWSWTNSGTAGVDTIQAFLDKNGNGLADIGEPQAIAGMTWIAPAAPVMSATASKQGAGQLGVTCGRTKFDWYAYEGGPATFIQEGEDVCVFLLSNDMARRMLQIALRNDTTIADVFAQAILSELYDEAIALDENILSDYSMDNEVKPVLSTATMAVPPISRIMRGAEKATGWAVDLYKALIVSAIEESGACVQINTDIDSGKLYVDSIPVFNPAYSSEDEPMTKARAWERREKKLRLDEFTPRPLGMSCNSDGLAELKGMSAEVMAPSEQAVLSLGYSRVCPAPRTSDGVSVTRVDLYAIGREGGAPWPRESDLQFDDTGTVCPAATDERGLFRGLSTFASGEDLAAAVKGQVWKLPAGTPLPDLAVVADGENYIPGSGLATSHHTIYPTASMDYAELRSLYQSLGWVHVGNTKRYTG